MTKTELAVAVAELTGTTKKGAEEAVTAVVDVITKAIATGEKVQIVGFGTFEAKTRAARTGRNPKTKEPIAIPATTVPTFKAGKAFKDAVAK
ncbi:MAG: HU family DNA-binding protein [Oscillospiraceae bacterium]|jgi:DNA-binding protein HU-beta|nr:HU family DNA-binding protein [Oscillospiraceae bacterium]